MKLSTLALAIAVALRSLASADEVVLRNGSTFVGAVREDGDRVTVEMDYGTVTFKKIDVRSISRGEDVVRTFEDRAAKANGPRELVDVALWGREKGLSRRAEDLLWRVIQLDPDQPDARKALGHEYVGGRWLHGDALQTARGLAKVQDQWVPAEVAERRLDRQAFDQQERDRIELAARVAAQRHEQEMLKLSLERERIELERKFEEQRAIEAERMRITMDWAMRTGTWGHPQNPPSHWNRDPQPDCPPPAAVPAPRPPVTPSPRDFSPLPPTPPTVLPITPPYRQPPMRQPHPKNEPKEDEEKDKKR